MAIFLQSTKKIKDIIKEIDSGKIRLPNFQRDYKWTPPKVKSLIHSIQHEFPAGSLLFLDVEEDSIIPYENFKYSSISQSAEKPKHLVLDGQQRMTSCYCAFTNKGYYTYYLNYFELYRQFSEGKTDFDFEEITVNKRHSQTPQNEISNGLFPLSFLSDRKTFNDAIAMYCKSYRDIPEKKDLGDFLTYNFMNIIDPIMDYEFPIINLSSELSLEAVCKVFQTINTTGLRLSVFDICVAVFMAKNINLKDKISKAKQDFPFAKIVLEKDETISLQTIALLAKVDPKASTLAKQLKQSDIVDYWDMAIKGIDIAMQILDDIGAGTRKSLDILPYTPVLPVIAAVVARKKYDTLNSSDKASITNKIKEYFYITALTTRYTEGTNNKIKDDYNSLIDWISANNSEEPNLISNGINWNTNKIILQNKGGAFGKAILCAINSMQPKDFYTDRRVGIGDNIESCELHHIFPKAEYGTSNPDLINSVFNFTWLSKDSNNFISDKKTLDYLNEIIETGTEPALILRLKNHGIENETYNNLKNEDLLSFLSNRANYIKEYLSAFNIRFNEIQPDDIDIEESELDDLIDE